MQRQSYIAAANRLRRFADQIESRCDARTPQQRRALTNAIYGASRFARAFSEKYRNREKIRVREKN